MRARHHNTAEEHVIIDGLELQAFVLRLGAALNAAGQPVYMVQQRLECVARAYGADNVRVNVLPTFLIVSIGRNEPATMELTSVATTPRLDRVAALDQLVDDAQHAAMTPADGLDRLDAIDRMRSRFGPVQDMVGYCVLVLGLCLILQPARREVAAAACLGAVVGLLRSFASRRPSVQVLVPFVAAVVVSAASAVAVRHELIPSGLRAIVASLVVFLPGVTLTTAVLELTAGQIVSGASRLVSGVTQLGLLTLGLIVGIEVAHTSSSRVLSDSSGRLGDWAPWVGVLVFAIGVMAAHSAPTRSFPSLLLVLFAAWVGQLAGNGLAGGYGSAFVGAIVMTAVAFGVARVPSAMSANAMFLPGFWLLVPGALGLIGFARVAGDASTAGTNDLVATAVTTFAVAIGVLTGTLLVESTRAVANGRRRSASRGNGRRRGRRLR